MPCITLRENTEWVETVEDGWNLLVGAESERIVGMVNDFEPEGNRGKFLGAVMQVGGL